MNSRHINFSGVVVVVLGISKNIIRSALSQTVEFSRDTGEVGEGELLGWVGICLPTYEPCVSVAHWALHPAADSVSGPTATSVTQAFLRAVAPFGL